MLTRKLTTHIPKPAKTFVNFLRSTIKHLVFIGSNYYARPNKAPVFILGNQKSGTSAIVSLLGMCTNLSVSVDLQREIGKQYYLEIVNKKIPFKKLVSRNRKDFSRDIIKEPNLTLFYEELCVEFPCAKHVMIIRDPRDNIRSILNRVNVPGNLETLGESNHYKIDPGFEIVLGSQWPSIKAMPHYIEQLAERWNHICDIYLANSNNICLLRYEDFNNNKEGTILNLAKTLGLTPKHSITNKVNIQFQSKGNRTITWKEFFGDKNLSKIESLCSSRMKQLGYNNI